MAQNSDMAAKLAALFKGSAPQGEPMPTAMPTSTQTPGTAADTAGDSAMPGATPTAGTSSPAVDQGKGGLLDALKNMVQFFSAKAGSASNTQKYANAMKDAGLSEDETGISK